MIGGLESPPIKARRPVASANVMASFFPMMPSRALEALLVSSCFKGARKKIGGGFVVEVFQIDFKKGRVNLEREKIRKQKGTIFSLEFLENLVIQNG